MGSKPARRNELDKIELQVATEFEKRAAGKRKIKQRMNQLPTAAGGTRIAAEVKAGKRLPPAVPKNKSLQEIREMDPDDDQFKDQTRGHRHRIWHDKDNSELNWRDMIRKEAQRKHNARRAMVRKHEAEVVKAVEVLSSPTTKEEHALGIYDEEKAIAEGILTLDDWDDEELVRGYRRNRSGKFGAAPKYVPREVQQEAFRRLVSRGERKMRAAYMKTIENLVSLAHDASSEKVRLDAQRELLNRVVGKVPDRMLVAREEPWEGILADSLVPLAELPPIEMEVGDDGTARAD